MHTVFALLCFVVVIHWLIFPYPSGLLHWHCGNLTIAPVPAKQPWWIWINTSCGFIMNDCITTTKQITTKPCAYFLGYTVYSCEAYIVGDDLSTVNWRYHACWWLGNSRIRIIIEHGTDTFYLRIGICSNRRLSWCLRAMTSLRYVEQKCLIQERINMSGWRLRFCDVIWVSDFLRSHNELHFDISRGRLNRKMSCQYKIPIMKIRRFHDSLIFMMKIPHFERPSLYWDGVQMAAAKARSEVRLCERTILHFLNVCGTEYKRAKCPTWSNFKFVTFDMHASALLCIAIEYRNGDILT